MAQFCTNPPILSLQILPFSSFSKQFVSKNMNSGKFTSNFSEKSVSAVPIFLNPNLFRHKDHCCTSSDSSTEENEYNSKIVFVKGLPQATAEGSLKRAFSQFGEVERIKIITDKKSKQPLGFAYIWFTKEESAQMAVKEMNGKFFDGRFVMVAIARPGLCKTRVKTAPYKF